MMGDTKITSRNGVVLIFPPLWMSVDVPFLSLPSLTGVLRANGITTVQIDLNQEFCTYLESDGFCRRLEAARQLRRSRDSLETRMPNGLGPDDTSCRAERPAKKGAQAISKLERTVQDIARLKGMPEAYDLTSAPYYLSGIRSGRTSLESLVSLSMDPTANFFLPYLKDVAAKRILKYDPVLVGFSVACPTQLLCTLALSQILRDEMGDHIHLTIGGFWGTMMADVLKSKPKFFRIVDSVSIGEGETACLELFKHTQAGHELSSVPSLLFRDTEKVRQTGRAPCLRGEQLPTPDFDGLFLDGYHGQGTSGPVLPIQSSRGCYWKRCRFCNYSSVRSEYTEITAGRLLDQILELQSRYNPSSFLFVDDVVAPQSLCRIADLLIQKDAGVTWSATSRIDAIFTDSTCRRIRDAGCEKIFFGIESGSQRLLDHIRKGITVSQIESVVANCADAGIEVAANFILHLPTETEEDRIMTDDLIQRLPLREELLTKSSFLLARGSDYFRNAAEFVPAAKMDVLSSNDVLLDFPMEYLT